MLQHQLSSPTIRQRLRSGPFAERVDGFADWLHGHGYKRASIDSILRSLFDWADAIQSTGISAQECLANFTLHTTDRPAVSHVRHRHPDNKKCAASAALFIRYLRELGVMPSLPSPASPAELWPIIGEFRAWMRQHRGLTETTLDVYQHIIAELVTALGSAPRRYTTEALRDFALKRARRHGIWRAKTVIVSVRAFLRYLGATGQCPAGMEHAIPGFASCQHSTIPRFLPTEDVERVIDSCPAHGNGLRDKAVILLLARLGLRASEVAQLRFDDLDWEQGQIVVSGKARRQERLPLPQAVGDALLNYLRQSRPPLRVPEVFTTVSAPIMPLSRAAVTRIVCRALRRAGVKAPINGAHVLRHSVATTMLRQGASLAGIGAVLRHRSPRTTVHYAKVDITLLSEIAQPWPEVSPC